MKSLEQIKKALKYRLYKLHPKAIFWDIKKKPNKNKPIVTKLKNGFQIQVYPRDILGKALYVLGYFEPDITNFCNTFLKPGMVFFDIGSNIGYYSLLASKKVGEKGKVYSFEPNNQIIVELKKNISLNSIKNIKVNQLALSEKKGKAKLSQYEKGEEVYSSLSNTAYPGKKITGYEKVNIDTVDNFIKKNNINKVDLIKIDVEGAELLVLKGSKKLLSDKKASAIIFEMQDFLTQRFNYTCEDLIQFLENFGYKIYFFNNMKKILLTKDFSFENSHINNFIALKTE
ncbi:MAG: FkbM family methyltransferase [Spirochaetia bacterium]|nr:FkbM family methyltransferase [Spirochaetia bacterium]